jgi:poly-gamma-glutamate capsule biosynthesis protein CapA/YwtB (metallophosphatase superfamily)
MVVIVFGGAFLGVAAFLLLGPGDEVIAAPSIDGPAAVETSRPSTTTTSTTTTAPSTTTTTKPGRPITIQGVGDVNFDPGYITAFATDGYAVAFEGLNGIFLDDDLTVINLECPPTDAGVQADKDYSFHCDPAALPIAFENGVDVANLANNHSQDRGVDGVLDGRANVATSGIAPVGVGGDLEEAMAPAVFDIDGTTVAVVGMGGVVPSDPWLATADHPGMASGDDIEQMVASVKAADEVADVVVVAIHWGVELVTKPSEDDRARAQAMIDAGADVIFGHHPHRLGELEFIDGVPVYWTLGNFIWPRLSDAGSTTAIARVTIAPDGSTEACLIPAFIERSGRPEIRGEAECEDAP